MTIPAVDFDHRLHCFPFAAQSLAGKGDGAGFRLGGEKGVRPGWFNSHSHTITFAPRPSKIIDAGQGIDYFNGGAVKRNSLTWIKLPFAGLNDICAVRINNDL